MKITKTTSRTNEVNFYPDAFRGMSWGSIRQSREKHGISNKKIEKCFCCGHAFTDEEKVIFITVSDLGNRLACGSCLELDQGSS